MFCPHCGAENAETAKFCKSCGKALSVQPQAAPAAAPVPPAAPVVQTAPVTYQAPVVQAAKPKKSKKKLAILCGSAALAVALVVVGAVLLFGGRYELKRPHADSAKHLGNYGEVSYTDENGIDYIFWDDHTATALTLDRNNYPANLVIPSQVQGYTVTEIGGDYQQTMMNMRCFALNLKSGYKGLKRVEIPNTVVRIAYASFANCADLEEVVIPNSVKTIAPMAFEGTPWLEKQKDEFVIVGDHVLIAYNGPARSKITVPEGVRCLGGAFYRHSQLEELVLPGSLRVIAEGALAAPNSSLEKVNLPNGLLAIDAAAFSGTKIDRFDLPSSMTEISNSALNSVASKVTIVWPEKLEKITVTEGQASIAEAVNAPLISYVCGGNPYSRTYLYVKKGSKAEQWMKDWEDLRGSTGSIIWSTDAPPAN